MKESRSTVPMRTAKIGNIAAALLLCCAGIFLLCKPDTSTVLIGNLIGITLLIAGAFRLIGYFSKDLYRLAFQFDLGLGVLLLVLGIVILVNPKNLLNFLCIATGIYVITDGLMKLQVANDSRRFGIQNWWLVLAAAILAFVFGVILLLRPSESAQFLVRMFGLVLLAEGILHLITIVITVKITQNQKPDIIEVNYMEGD